MSLSGWNSNNKLKLHIDHSKIGEELTNFPILVVLSSRTGINDSDVTKVFDELSTVSGSKRIAVTTSEDTQCRVEIERWDWVNKEAYLWVKVPTVDHCSDTDLYLYYDSTHADNDYELGNLCIHSDDSDGSTNIVDSSIRTHSITVHGNAHHEVDQHKFGSSSIYFDGSGDYLSLLSNTDWYLGTGDFTVDFWMNPINGGLGNNYPRLLQLGPNATNGGLWIVGQTTNPNKIMVQGYSGGYFTPLNSGSTLPNNTWTHVAIVRKNGVFYMFIGGVLKSSDAGHTTYNIVQNAVYIGSNNSGSESYYGYLDEYRVSKGIARWTSNFTPPTSQYKMGYVGDTGDLIAQQVWDSNFVGVWHMNQDPTGAGYCMLDSTSNAHHGDPQAALGSDDLVDGQIGKAIEFDGTGLGDRIDFETSSDFAFGTNDFTIEHVVYPTSSGTVWCNYESANKLHVPYFDSATSCRILINGANNVTSIVTTASVYQQFIAVRSADELKAYINDVQSGTTGNVTGVSIGENTNNFIGCSTDAGHAFSGRVDEVRISNIARNAAWRKATYNSNWDNLIYFDVFEGYFSGTVSELSTTVSGAVVYLYKQTDGSFVGSTTSSGNGGFYIETTYSGAHFLVCVDPVGGEDYNNLIYGDMYPVTISG